MSDLIDFGAGMDWITPTLAMLSGRSELVVPADDQVATQEALADAGIKIKHQQLIDGQFAFTVASEDLDAAIAILGGERKPAGVGCGWWLALAALLTVLVIAMGGV